MISDHRWRGGFLSSARFAKERHKKISVLIHFNF